MLFMIIEHFKDPLLVYRRLREHDRMLPEGLTYVSSWVAATFKLCFQLMECEDLTVLQEWLLQWQDLGDYEIVPVVESAQARKVIEPFL
ncbi:MAG TPA: DUF3303 family protein [Candidatus Lokiarchaeia archaeon]|nr:DUF3303 family protein [Candidatus Lokiarchaeia archaeon]